MLEVRNPQDGLITISGEIDVSNITGLRKELEGCIQARKSSGLKIDLSNIETFNSAVVSLLLCLVRKAKRVSCELSFTELPDGLLAMAQVGGLESMLAEYSA